MRFTYKEVPNKLYQLTATHRYEFKIMTTYLRQDQLDDIMEFQRKSYRTLWNLSWEQVI